MTCPTCGAPVLARLTSGHRVVPRKVLLDPERVAGGRYLDEPPFAYEIAGPEACMYPKGWNEHRCEVRRVA